MGEKVTFYPITKIIQIDISPVDGIVNLNVKIDLYSDGKEDWITDATLTKIPFPIRSVGGDPLPAGRALGATFFLDNAWKIRPYEGDHILNVVGNLFSENGSSPFTKTIGDYNIFTTSEVSSIITSVISSGGESIWTINEKDGIINNISDVKTKTDNLPTNTAQELTDIDSSIEGVDGKTDDIKKQIWGLY